MTKPLALVAVSTQPACTWAGCRLSADRCTSNRSLQEGGGISSGLHLTHALFLILLLTVSFLLTKWLSPWDAGSLSSEFEEWLSLCTGCLVCSGSALLFSSCLHPSPASLWIQSLKDLIQVSLPQEDFSDYSQPGQWF